MRSALDTLGACSVHQLEDIAEQIRGIRPHPGVYCQSWLWLRDALNGAADEK
jgi:hypothetical protein